MILKRLVLRNFRNFKNKEVSFTKGVNGIVGRNGKGKTTILEAFFFLCTGELFTGERDSAINVDEDTGYVAGYLELNDKEVYIERHLDNPKVLLKYDGKTYKKATEIKEFFEAHLQISPDILKHVIIARQGNIPQLFSGDRSVREKIFQKIFLVPAAEKIRNIIWKDYIKTAPDLIPVEDENYLVELKTAQENKITELTEKINGISILTEQEREELKERGKFIRKCMDDAGKRVILQQQINVHTETKRELEVKIKDLESMLSSVDVNLFQSQKNLLLQHKGLFQQKQKLEKQLAELPELDGPEFRASCIYSKSAAESNLRSVEKDKVTAEVNIASLKKKIKELQEHIEEEAGRCPTCGAPGFNIDATLTANKLELEGWYLSLTGAETKINEFKGEIDGFTDSIKRFDELARDRERITGQLDQLKEVEFSQEDLDCINEAITQYFALKDECNGHKTNLHDIIGTIREASIELSNTAEYNKPEHPSIELDTLGTIYQADLESARQLNSLQVELKVANSEYNTIQNRIKNNKENFVKNERRNKYYSVLNKVYEVLHASQFPRKLIMGYADFVCTYLREYLEMYNFPYSARITENFQIEMTNENGRVIPKVSGGQEIQVGVSLHFALHDLFSQSFPMMLIDEGTTCLDEEMQQAYFAIIKGLKEKSSIKQVIIVDHSQQLTNVVDNVINVTDD